MNWSALVPLALGAGGAYFGYKAQKNTKKNSERAYEAYLAQQEARAAAQGSGGGRSGGGGGGSNGTLSALMGNQQRLDKQYGLALELLKPYVDASAAALPKQNELYMKGLDGMNNIASSFLNQDMIKKLAETPSPSSFERPLPSFLMGGK